MNQHPAIVPGFLFASCNIPKMAYNSLVARKEGTVRQKGAVTRIGKIERGGPRPGWTFMSTPKERVVLTGFEFSGGDYPLVEATEDGSILMCGWTADELIEMASCDTSRSQPAC